MEKTWYSGILLPRFFPNKADNPAIGAEQRMLKLFEFYILNFENFRLLIQLKSCNKEEKSV